MMPLCHYRRCTNSAEVKLGEIHTDDEGECWVETFYLCEKHAKKIEKKLLTELYRR
jgi:hypothetical protein